MSDYKLWYFAPSVQTGRYEDSEGHVHAVMYVTILVPANFTWVINYSETDGVLSVDLDDSGPTEILPTPIGEGLRVIHYKVDTLQSNLEANSETPRFHLQVNGPTGYGNFDLSARIWNNSLPAPSPVAVYNFAANAPFMQLVRKDDESNLYYANMIVKLKAGSYVKSVDVNANTAIITLKIATYETSSVDGFLDTWICESIQRPRGVQQLLVNVQDMEGNPLGTGNLDFDDADAGVDPVVQGG